MDFYNQIINIDEWRHDERYNGIYSEGAREKDVFFSPDSPNVSCIKPDWRYMFKLSRSLEWCPWQFWIEIIAYRLGCLIGVQVPPAHAGYTSQYSSSGLDKKVAYGALIEWFYNQDRDIFILGGQFMVQLIKNYDRDKGKNHNFGSIDGLYGKLPRFVEHWTGVFVLDSLIANTDRHHDNWGLVIRNAKPDPKKADDLSFSPELSFSPAFDNGTAMEYGENEENFCKFKDPVKLNKHLTDPKFAKHHMRWSLKDNAPLNYFQFVNEFVLKYPESKHIISKHLSFTREQAEEILFPLCDITSDQQYRLSSARLEFMLDMVFHRKRLLENTLKL